MKLIRALNHEVRRKILRALAANDEALSPVVMAKRLNIPLSTVSYHVNILRSCEAVEGAGVQQVRGAVEHFYNTCSKRTRSPAPCSSRPGRSTAKTSSRSPR